MPDFRTVVIDQDPQHPRIARLVLNRPEKLNAIAETTPTDIRHAVEWAQAEDEADLQGLTVAADEAGYAVGLDTSLTPELREEGLARELVHRIQNLRKAAGLEISDRIVTYYDGWPELRQLLLRHGEYVRQETLSLELVEGAPPPDAFAQEQVLDGQRVLLAVRRAG